MTGNEAFSPEEMMILWMSFLAGINGLNSKISERSLRYDWNRLNVGACRQVFPTARINSEVAADGARRHEGEDFGWNLTVEGDS